MARMGYTATCPRMVQDEDYPYGPLVACEGSVSAEGWETAGGWHEPPDGERDSEWGACDMCGHSDWTDAEQDAFDNDHESTDLDAEGWANHREEHGR